MNAALHELVQYLPLDDKLVLLDILHEQVSQTLNLMPVPTTVLHELENVLHRMKTAPQKAIPWREALQKQ
jgi:hypothetical protein